MKSKCRKKSDEIFMDCGSNDDAVYAQARQIKQLEIKIFYLKVLFAVAERARQS